MSKTKLNKEDVPSTVAGFYFQALLACREISNLANVENDENICVGIERGADVIIKKSTTTKSIEAKFYGEKFTHNSDEIRHSLYNFYKNSFDHDELVFETNVIIQDDTIIKFGDWNKIIDISNQDEYISYLHECVIRESVDKEKNNPEFDLFDKYRINEGYVKKNNYNPKSKYVNLIINSTRENDYDYMHKSAGRTKADEIIFLKNIKFVSRNQIEIVKAKAIEEIKKEIETNINQFIASNNQITNEPSIIRTYLIDKFLQTTVVPTDVDEKKYAIKDDFDFIKIKDFKQYCEEANESSLKLINDNKIKEIISKISENEKLFLEKVKYSDTNDNIKLKLICNHYSIQNALLHEISLKSYSEIIEKFAFEGFEANFLFSELIPLITIYSTVKNIDLTNLKFEKILSFANVVMSKENEFCYLFGGDLAYFSDFMYQFINKTEPIFETHDFDYPIIVNANLKVLPCELYEPLSLATNIARLNLSEDKLRLYEQLDFRCSKCLYFNRTYNETIHRMSKYDNCPKKKSEIKNSGSL